MTSSQRTISVVVPVYNGEKTVRTLTERIARVCHEHGWAYEAVLVNDGSADQSWSELSALASENNAVVAANMMRNYGQNSALLAGIHLATGDVIVTIDDDLQQPPEEIPKLIAKLEEGFDLVYGRPAEVQASAWRKLVGRIARWSLVAASGNKSLTGVTSFRAFRSEVRSAFDRFAGPNPLIDLLLTWGASRLAFVPVKHELREFGESGYTFRRLMRLMMTALISISTWPFRVASLAGIGLVLFGIAVIVYLEILYAIGRPGTGFTLLAAVILILSGTQLLGLGLVGQYLGRIHETSSGRPAYVLKETISRRAGDRGLVVEPTVESE
ncbi:MAG TPA: glycosyltransferase [Actinomycetota bacterium]|jgi:undecaprenyl-phosphate 4-deoxy-4-formamido-L-arabinose transferase|nr:glycosyltransferase [Actinomycetota bacterium]